jgi:hypothetical protein
VGGEGGLVAGGEEVNTVRGYLVIPIIFSGGSIVIVLLGNDMRRAAVMFLAAGFAFGYIYAESICRYHHEHSIDNWLYA